MGFCFRNMLMLKWRHRFQILVSFVLLPYDIWSILKCRLHFRNMWEHNAIEGNSAGNMMTLFIYLFLKKKIEILFTCKISDCNVFFSNGGNSPNQLFRDSIQKAYCAKVLAPLLALFEINCHCHCKFTNSMAHPLPSSN